MMNCPRIYKKINLSNKKIIISPGPGSPENKDYFGICSDVILKNGSQIPILGVPWDARYMLFVWREGH